MYFPTTIKLHFFFFFVNKSWGISYAQPHILYRDSLQRPAIQLELRTAGNKEFFITQKNSNFIEIAQSLTSATYRTAHHANTFRTSRVCPNTVVTAKPFYGHVRPIVMDTELVVASYSTHTPSVLTWWPERCTRRTAPAGSVSL